MLANSRYVVYCCSIGDYFVLKSIYVKLILFYCSKMYFVHTSGENNVPMRVAAINL